MTLEAPVSLPVRGTNRAYHLLSQEFNPTFTERDAVARNYPFVPVLLSISGCGTVSARSDQALMRHAQPALTSQDTPSSSTPAPLQTSLTFWWLKRLLVCYPNGNLRRLYEGYCDDTFVKCFCAFLTARIAFGGEDSRSCELDTGRRPANSLRSRPSLRL
jgi:hypothetical protein